MAKIIRLSKALRELNISLERAVEYLSSKGVDIEPRLTAKISEEIHRLLSEEFETDANKKTASLEINEAKQKEQEALREQIEKEKLANEPKKEKEAISPRVVLSGPKKIGTIDLHPKKVIAEKEQTSETKKEAGEGKKEVTQPPKAKTQNESKQKTEAPKTEKALPEKEIPQKIETQYQKLSGPKLSGEKIDLKKFDTRSKKGKKAEDEKKKQNEGRKRRRRIQKEGQSNFRGVNQRRAKFGKSKKFVPKEEPTEEEVQKQIRETLEKLQGKANKGKAAKYRREKRELHKEQTQKSIEEQEAESKTLKVAEFVTVSEIALMMNLPVTDIISACMSLGLMVTMNQRLDAETLSVVAEEFGFEVQFISEDLEEDMIGEEEAEEDLKKRAPIVTIMGHVDHGKTSLLDYIREENVIAGESGGITQHIGAYGVKLDAGERITFLDTPGHEAFTAMRARGAQLTDIVIIVIAADDDIKPQTKEAISHAQAANVPIVFAINKVDKPNANPDKIKEGLAAMNLMVEDWGGKVQSHDISAKTGEGVTDLLEKVLLEAEMLELKANPNRLAVGTVIEAFLDKGRGYVTTLLIQKGTLKIGDYVLAGKHSGKVKAMDDEWGNKLTDAEPSRPVSILGLDGAPKAGDKFTVYEDEKEAKQIAVKRTQQQREFSARTQKHITLDEIGRRIALGDFKELNIILKGDVDGSVEAITNALQNLSTEEIQVNIVHKDVGAITENDVLLASASDAIIIGFNVRPMGKAKSLAEKEEIDIRTYSIIYNAIDDVKDAMEGMLSPELKEEVTGGAEIREVFKISKLGSIAGCMVTSGTVFRNSKVRLIREGVVVHSGELASLKRFKDDAKEVKKGYDCGLQLNNYNDIKEGDLIEAYTEIKVRKKLGFIHL